nr:hypothetical protein L203_00607 [Cryptococcus depauperatus CBS 7841]
MESRDSVRSPPPPPTYPSDSNYDLEAAGGKVKEPAWRTLLNGLKVPLGSHNQSQSFYDGPSSNWGKDSWLGSATRSIAGLVRGDARKSALDEEAGSWDDCRRSVKDTRVS